MGARAKYEIPAPLKEAQERFEQWRSSQTGRRPIPESLWALASELARQMASSVRPRCYGSTTPSGSGALRRPRWRHLSQPHNRHSWS